MMVCGYPAGGAGAAAGGSPAGAAPGPAQARPAPACADDTNRYVDCANGTVTDTVTGLIWLANANCFGSQTYANAVTIVGTLATGVKNELPVFS